MKVKLKESKRLSIIILLLVALNLNVVFASEEKLYQAYSIASSNNIRVLDGENGEENIAYCYNRDYNIPGIKEGDETEKTYYTRIESYLDSNDESTDQYGKEKKEKIAAVLVAGYPLDTYGLCAKYKLTEFKARYITQKLIWDINDGKDEYIKSDSSDDLYYNELLRHSKIDKFRQGNLDLIGNFEFEKKQDYWSTSKLSTIGENGILKFDNLPEDMKIVDFNTNKILGNDIKVGQEFYIVSKNKPSEDLNLKIKYEYQVVKLYFYKYHSGGMPFNPNKPFQNLVRGDLTDKIKEIPLEIKLNGNFEKPTLPGDSEESGKPEIPEIGGTTPDLPGDSGESGKPETSDSTPDLPSVTPSLPGDSQESVKPETPETDDSIPNLPDIEESTPSLPGDIEESVKPETPETDSSTPDLPGIEGNTPSLPGDSQESGKPETPETNGSTPNVPNIEETKPPLLEDNEESSESTQNTINPKTGDTSTLGFIMLGFSSLIGLALNNYKFK